MTARWTVVDAASLALLVAVPWRLELGADRLCKGQFCDSSACSVEPGECTGCCSPDKCPCADAPTSDGCR